MTNKTKAEMSEQSFTEKEQRQLKQSIEQLTGAVDDILDENSGREYTESRQEIICSLRTIASMLL
jgi:hypothetical protein